jgi:ABC-type sugar transport system permease subunit
MAWVPLVLADAWKTTPFVTILLLAGLQGIDRSLLEAAAIDGAGTWRSFTRVTLPLLRPALLVAFVFRTLDAFRAFDVVYVMTGGGPGTATELIAPFTFTMLLQHLRFGYGSALSVLVFLAALGFALVTVRIFGGNVLVERRR